MFCPPIFINKTYICNGLKVRFKFKILGSLAPLPMFCAEHGSTDGSVVGHMFCTLVMCSTVRGIEGLGTQGFTDPGSRHKAI